MKRHLDNIEITRRAALKGLTILTAAAFLPTALFFGDEDEKMTHFIGLGGAGTNAVEFLFKNGIKGKFTCVSYPQRPKLPK